MFRLYAFLGVSFWLLSFPLGAEEIVAPGTIRANVSLHVRAHNQDASLGDDALFVISKPIAQVWNDLLDSEAQGQGEDILCVDQDGETQCFLYFEDVVKGLISQVDEAAIELKSKLPKSEATAYLIVRQEDPFAYKSVWLNEGMLMIFDEPAQYFYRALQANGSEVLEKQLDSRTDENEVKSVLPLLSSTEGEDIICHRNGGGFRGEIYHCRLSIMDLEKGKVGSRP